MRIDMWLDTCDPWSYLGLRHLRSAMASFDHGDQIEVYLHAYLLDPDLEAAVDKRSAARGRQVRLADVVATGIISPGDTFVWRRRNLGSVYVVTISAEGTIVLPDGTDVASPSAAIKELTGNSSAAALDVFVRESDGKKLRDLWDKYRSRFAS